MTPERIKELAALSATGALECPDAAAWAGLLAEGDALAWKELAANREALAAVALTQAPPRQPPASLKARILARAQASTGESTAQVEKAPAPPSFRNLRKGEGPWLPMPIPGLRVKLLSLDPSRNYALVYAEIDAGVGYPEHHHTASEEIYVMTGDLMVNGTLLQAGDFHHAEGDTHHTEVTSVSGCTALLLVPAESLLAH